MKPILSREWAMPNKWTFKIKPIKDIIERYVGNGKNWIDPFSGEAHFAEITNDLNHDRKAQYNLKCEDFIKLLPGPRNIKARLPC